MPSLNLHLTDCRDVMRDMPDGSVNLIVTDPPYFKVKGEAWDRQWKDADKFLAWLGEIADEWKRVLAPNGALYCFASPQMSARVEVLISERLQVLNHITWAKPGGTWAAVYGEERFRSYVNKSERVVFAEQYGTESKARDAGGYVKACEELRARVMLPLRKYLLDALHVSGCTLQQVDGAWQSMRGTKGRMSPHWFGNTHQWELPTAAHYVFLQGVLGVALSREYEELRAEYEELRAEYEELRAEYEELRRPFNVSAEVPYTDVWAYPTVSRYLGKHPCEKPYDMARDIVRASSRAGDVVFDPFMGSGVFGKAALNEGRSFVGCDMTEKYFARARTELEALT